MKDLQQQLFFSTRIEGDTLILEDQEAVHCSLVLRKRQGDIIQVVDGKGTLYKAGIDLLAKRTVSCTILSQSTEDNPNHLSLAVAPTKNRDRLEWMTEKVVELGVKELLFIYTAHSERIKVNMERIHKKALAAMKQSLRLHMPLISQCNFEDLMKRESKHKFIAHCAEDSPKSGWTSPKDDCIILIGPEGDFSQEELNQAFANGYSGLDLGKYRLRTETAAISAAVLVNQA